MAHHAYLYAGEKEAGIAAARAFAADTLGLPAEGSPDLAVFEYGLFSVDDARAVAGFAAQAPASGERKMLVISAGRLFHEAQNALLKLFEEPSEGTTLVLIVPAEGMLLPTLRSRLLPLPSEATPGIGPEAEAFLAAGKAEREKIVAKLLARAKSDKDEEKQAARAEAARLAAGVTRAAYAARRGAQGKEARELDLLLSDLARFAPVLHERSAPLKLIFEHLLLVLPARLGK